MVGFPTEASSMSFQSLPALTLPMSAAPHRSRRGAGGGLAAPLLRGLFLVIVLVLPMIGGTLGARLDGGAGRTGASRPTTGPMR